MQNTFNLNNSALPEEEARDLATHVKMCTIRQAQTIDEIVKTKESIIKFFEERDSDLRKDLQDYISRSDTRHTRNEKAAVIAFFVIAASLWPQITNILAPIASAFTGFVIPAARALTGL